MFKSFRSMARKETKRRSFDEVEKYLKKEKLLEGVQRDIERVKTGIPGIDYILGGGVPKGRIIEIFGYEESGKTTFSATLGKAVQMPGARFLFWDFEQTMSLEYFEALGIDTSKKLFKWEQPSSLESGVDSLIGFIETGEVGVAIVDSLSSMLPVDELRGRVADSNIALQARKISQFLRRVTPLVARTGTTLILVSHLKDKIGSAFPQSSSTGGRSPKFYASIRIEMRISASVSFKRSMTSTQARLRKNKTTRRMRDVISFPIGDGGIDLPYHVFDCLVASNLVRTKGSWYYLGEKRIAQGEEKFLNVIKADPSPFLTMLEGYYEDQRTG